MTDSEQCVVRSNDVVFEEGSDEANATVSHLHAHIRLDAGEHRVCDDESEFETRVFRDGRPIEVSAGNRRGDCALIAVLGPCADSDSRYGEVSFLITVMGCPRDIPRRPRRLSTGTRRRRQNTMKAESKERRAASVAPTGTETMSSERDREYLFRVLFRLEVHQSQGDAFQCLFGTVMKYADPRFRLVAPWGDWGDGGNDGWIAEDGHYFQVYGPKATTRYEDICMTALGKAIDDFAKLPKKMDGCPSIHLRDE